jgi:protein-tyrosine-phosphatase
MKTHSALQTLISVTLLLLGLTNLPDVEFDVVVTMGCGDECPIVRAKRREDWNIPDPKDLPPEEFRTVRDLIEKKVKALIDEL